MNDHQSDFEELRPLGEATSTPDAELVGRVDKEPVDDLTENQGESLALQRGDESDNPPHSTA